MNKVLCMLYTVYGIASVILGEVKAVRAQLTRIEKWLTILEMRGYSYIDEGKEE